MNDVQREQARKVYRDAELAIHQFVNTKLNPQVAQDKQRIRQEKQEQGMQLMKQKSVQMAKDITKGVMKDAINAYIDSFPAGTEPGKPKLLLKRICDEIGYEDFGQIFQRFTKEAGVYGFGDIQVYRLFESLKSNN